MMEIAELTEVGLKDTTVSGNNDYYHQYDIRAGEAAEPTNIFW